MIIISRFNTYDNLSEKKHIYANSRIPTPFTISVLTRHLTLKENGDDDHQFIDKFTNIRRK